MLIVVVKKLTEDSRSLRIDDDNSNECDKEVNSKR